MTHDDMGQFTGQICTPFTFHYNYIERLLLINFEQDPDDIYIGFEPQILNDPKKGAGLLVIGWRHDGTVDVYHQPRLTLQREDYDIVGNGLSDFFSRPFDNAQFEIGEHGLNLHLEFVDRDERRVMLRIHEQNAGRRKPFGLLAPFPADAQNSPAMPIPLLYDFYFVRRTKTDITVQIDGKTYQPDMLPAPIDGRRVYFSRYSPDPFIVLFNQAYDGPLPLQSVGEGTHDVTHGDTVYEIQTKDGYPEIVAIRTNQSQRHQVRLTFTPAFPDLLHLQNGANVVGSWHMDLEEAIGYIAGTYRVQCSGDCIEIEMHPSEGWRPRISKLSVWFMFRVAPIFRQWPQYYRWHATIDLSQPDTPHLSSHWHKSE